ncbi:protein jagged-1b isoform X2 [Folsomia candida]|nr:protein jagged-1b isoform X2 [Folsomia candida]
MKLSQLVGMLVLWFVAFTWSTSHAQSVCLAGDPNRCPDHGGCSGLSLNGGPLCNRTSQCCQCVQNQCQDVTDCNWMSCTGGETASCILKRVGRECVCTGDNYCTTNGTQACPSDKFPRNAVSNYERLCHRNRSRIVTLCKADRYREECNCVAGGLIRLCSVNEDCTCGDEEMTRHCDTLFGRCSCYATCETDATCTARRKCGPGAQSKCILGGWFGTQCTPCRFQCNSDSACSRVNCTANTPFRKCENNICACRECTANSDCSHKICPARKPYKECTSNVCGCFECQETSQCPECNGDLRKLCSRGGTCKCLRPNG